MATSKKKSRSKSTPAKKKSSVKKKQTTSDFPWKTELILFAVLAFSIILFISNIGFGGLLGRGLRYLFFGLFGFFSYFVPFFVFFFCAFWLSNSKQSKEISKKRTIKTVGASMLLLFLCMLAHLIHFQRRTPDFLQIFKECQTLRSGGGLIGAFLGRGFTVLVGLLGAYVIAVVMILISLMLLTEKTFFLLIAEKGKTVLEELHAARDSQKPFNQKEKQRKEERIRRREAKKRAKEESKKRVDQWETEQIPIPSPDQAVSDKTILSEEPIAPVIHTPNESAEQKRVPSPARSLVKKQTAKGKQEEASLEDTEREIRQTETPHMDYVFPPYDLLNPPDYSGGDSRKHLEEMSKRLQMTLTNFGVNARVTDVTCGPSVTRYEIQPDIGVKVNKIVNLADDIKLNLAVADIRIEAPIPGKAAIGIEVPNKDNVTVSFRELIESKTFQKSKSKLVFGAGKDISGNIIIADIAKMPHLMIAGATGSGKSVCINSIIMSILYHATPDEVKLIMIDPKVVELSGYNGIPHLLLPVVTDPKKAAGALNWAVREMTERYKKFAQYHVRNIQHYNEAIESFKDTEQEPPEKMPQILIIVDELADLMMAAPGDVEGAICRLAQLARAAGIHLIIATQRPSVNVITGLIKANMPSRIAFSVASGVDSRTILGTNGAEKLLGKGDMLYHPQSLQKPLRVQGSFLSDEEVNSVVAYIIEHNKETQYNADIEQQVATHSESSSSSDGIQKDDRDVYFVEAGHFIIEKDKGSIGMLQRMFKVGFNRAARIMDQLEEAGVVGPEEGTKPRRILMTDAEFIEYVNANNLGGTRDEI